MLNDGQWKFQIKLVFQTKKGKSICGIFRQMTGN